MTDLIIPNLDETVAPGVTAEPALESSVETVLLVVPEPGDKVEAEPSTTAEAVGGAMSEPANTGLAAPDATTEAVGGAVSEPANTGLAAPDATTEAVWGAVSGPANTGLAEPDATTETVPVAVLECDITAEAQSGTSAESAGGSQSTGMGETDSPDKELIGLRSGEKDSGPRAVLQAGGQWLTAIRAFFTGRAGLPAPQNGVESPWVEDGLKTCRSMHRLLMLVSAIVIGSFYAAPEPPAINRRDIEAMGAFEEELMSSFRKLGSDFSIEPKHPGMICLIDMKDMRMYEPKEFWSSYNEDRQIIDLTPIDPMHEYQVFGWGGMDSQIDAMLLRSDKRDKEGVSGEERGDVVQQSFTEFIGADQVRAPAGALARSYFRCDGQRISIDDSGLFLFGIWCREMYSPAACEVVAGRLALHGFRPVGPIGASIPGDPRPTLAKFEKKVKEYSLYGEIKYMTLREAQNELRARREAELQALEQGKYSVGDVPVPVPKLAIVILVVMAVYFGLYVRFVCVGIRSGSIPAAKMRQFPWPGTMPGITVGVLFAGTLLCFPMFACVASFRYYESVAAILSAAPCVHCGSDAAMSLADPGIVLKSPWTAVPGVVFVAVTIQSVGLRFWGWRQ